MAGCPYCHTPTRNNAKFCNSCGANLSLPEFDRAFCPQCGARVRSRQWFCQECQWPLEDEIDNGPPLAEVLRVEEPSPPALVTAAKAPPRRATRIIAGLLSSVLVISVLLWAVMRRIPRAPLVVPKRMATEMPKQPAILPNLTYSAASQSTPGGEPSAKVAAASDRAVVQNQLEVVLNNLREAQLEKNSAKYLNSYVSSFPGLNKKHQKTLATWKKYDYLVLDYDLRHLSLQDQETLALVTWNMETMNRGNGEKHKSTLTYKVWFSREPDGWRIKNLAPVVSP